MDRVFDLYSRQLVLTAHDRKLSLVSEKLAWVSKSVIECVMSLSLNYLTWVEMHRREKCAKNFLAFSALIYVKFVCAINKNFLSKIAFTIDEGPIYQQNDMEENRDYSVGMLEWLMQFCWWHAKLCVRNWY